jgi:hypothetical protein
MFTAREAAAALRELREDAGLTQSALAVKASGSRSFADVGAGKPTVEASKLFDLVQALGSLIPAR